MDPTLLQSVIAMLGEDLSLRVAPHLEIVHDRIERISYVKININTFELRTLVLAKMDVDALTRINFCTFAIGPSYITFGRYF